MRCWSCSLLSFPKSGSDVRPVEIVAHIQQGRAQSLRQSIGKAIAEIQLRRMTETFSETDAGVEREAGLLAIQRSQLDVKFGYPFPQLTQSCRGVGNPLAG